MQLAAAVVALSMAGCMTARPRLAATAEPAPTVGYVGAVFAKDTVTRFGFTLEDEGGQRYTLPLANGFGLIDLPPGRYQVVEWVTAALTGEILTKGEIPGDDALARPFGLAGGQVVLLGKWKGERKIGFGSNTFSVARQALTLGDARAALREAYPKFEFAPVSCWLCTP